MSETDLGVAVLSKREHEVASAYAAGQSYKEIARDLGLSPTTVRSHLRTVYGKLQVTSKIELVRRLNGSSDPGVTGERDNAALVAELALELDEAIRRERVLANVLRIISRDGHRIDAVIDAVLDHALEICDAEFGILFEYRGDLSFRELRSRGIAPAFGTWLAEQGTFAVDADTGLGRVAATLQTVNIADVRGEDIYRSGAPLRIATADLGKARSFAAIPMMSGLELIGAFTVYRTRVHPFSERSLELAQLFAMKASIAIENARGRAMSRA
ncbi:MAG: LuxR C-terminal-related transcriptional regulator [Pseudomonadota bacterium]